MCIHYGFLDGYRDELSRLVLRFSKIFYFSFYHLFYMFVHNNRIFTWLATICCQLFTMIHTKMS